MGSALRLGLEAEACGECFEQVLETQSLNSGACTASDYTGWEERSHLDKLALLTAAAAMLCVAGLAFFASEGEPAKVRIDEISAGMEGRLVSVGGRVMRIDSRNGNYFVSLCGRQCVRVVVFSKTAAAMRRKNLDLAALEAGSRISVTGVVRYSSSGPSVIALSADAVEVNS